MSKILIKGGTVINEGARSKKDLLIDDGFFAAVDGSFDHRVADHVVDAQGLLVLPGIIDDQVHFRQPGLEQKGTIATESRAAVAGGITSFMEMPNTVPPAVTMELLREKVEIAQKGSWCNFSFYLGATNDNLEELMRINPADVCGIKVFMGSSTGNLLVDDDTALRNIFGNAEVPIAVHSEDEETVQANLRRFRQEKGDNPDPSVHPLIRSTEACVICTKRAIEHCRAGGGHLHLLHISTADEVDLIRRAKSEKLPVTAEVCVHHLVFCDDDYAGRGNFIKWNPAIKSRGDRDALVEGLLDGTIDIVATDHAPHELEKKRGDYFSAPSGGPMVEHSLLTMLELASSGKFSVEHVVDWMAHKPADLFRIDRRGYIREGYHADLVLVDPFDPWTVEGAKSLYLVGWSPLEGMGLSSKVHTTFVNGRMVYHKGHFFEGERDPMALKFNR